MKREIKFRVWLNNQMCYPGNEIAEIYFDGNPWDNSSGILMQYTGLKDKNGKEVYEGDIVLTSGYQNPLSGEIESNLCVVEYRGITLCYVEYYANEGESGKRITPVSDYIDYDCDVDEDCEVIGNIYENAELIDP